jgi:hypothetical protein
MRKFLAVLALLGTPSYAVPVVPNFKQGSMTSHTETTSKVVETINSIDYNTGWQYSVTGTNVQHSGSSMSPSAIDTTNQTINGVTSKWTGLDAANKPNWTIVNPGGAFQFTESYSGPGLSNQTIIQRETTIESITDTTSVFQQ